MYYLARNLLFPVFACFFLLNNDFLRSLHAKLHKVSVFSKKGVFIRSYKMIYSSISDNNWHCICRNDWHRKLGSLIDICEGPSINCTFRKKKCERYQLLITISNLHNFLSETRFSDPSRL